MSASNVSVHVLSSPRTVRFARIADKNSVRMNNCVQRNDACVESAASTGVDDDSALSERTVRANVLMPSK
jgi:hypothetical protein